MDSRMCVRGVARVLQIEILVVGEISEKRIAGLQLDRGLIGSKRNLDRHEKQNLTSRVHNNVALFPWC